MAKEKLTVFASDDNEYEIKSNYDKLASFKDEFGYAFILTFSSELDALANRLKDIKYVIDILEEWKKEDFFKLNKTIYEIRWSVYSCKSEDAKVTLPQAKKLYKETKVLYNTLLKIVNETYRIHGKNEDGTLYDPKEFLTEIEI